MDLMEAMRARHSVRSYLDRPIEGETAEKLEREAAACNEAGGLAIRLAFDEPRAFGGRIAHYGAFRGVKNYMVLAGRGEDLPQRCGYYGERLVLFAQTLGLSTCWVALNYSRGAAGVQLEPGEKLCCLVALGYGREPGVPHRNKPWDKLFRAGEPVPAWFKAGAEAALLAPTAMNQQRFRISLEGTGVRAKALPGVLTRLDLGIVKYHFETGAGRENFHWL
ncbi:nitroreductase family protein [Gehongia tenuis]|uniref:Nitroreductase n=1 Tax=Gehongia tenuis TaxID=2763655 RepID=A0A926D2B1_9FIRM|nr:nitroreductase family protein [Gehongia tenuis]MBC8530453.1 nitroreductase [Gehongia tenuis]